MAVSVFHFHPPDDTVTEPIPQVCVSRVRYDVMSGWRCVFVQAIPRERDFRLPLLPVSRDVDAPYLEYGRGCQCHPAPIEWGWRCQTPQYGIQFSRWWTFGEIPLVTEAEAAYRREIYLRGLQNVSFTQTFSFDGHVRCLHGCLPLSSVYGFIRRLSLRGSRENSDQGSPGVTFQTTKGERRWSVKPFPRVKTVNSDRTARRHGS